MNVYGSGDGEFEEIGSVSGVESCKIMFIAGEEAHHVHLFRQSCYRMYRLSTIHFVTDRHTDRENKISCQ